MSDMAGHTARVAVDGGGSCRDARRVSLANVRPISLKDSRTPDETFSRAEIHRLNPLCRLPYQPFFCIFSTDASPSEVTTKAILFPLFSVAIRKPLRIF